MLSPVRDRGEAGRKLAEKPADYAGRPDVLVLALPRDGVRAPLKSLGRWRRRSTTSSSASWGSRATRSWPWAAGRLPRAQRPDREGGRVGARLAPR